MFKLWVIAHREYVAMVGTKAFLFTLVMMPILMFGSLLAMPLLNRVSGGKTQKIVVADGTGQLFEKLVQATIARNISIATNPIERIETKKGKPGSTFMDQRADIWELVEGPSDLTDEDRLKISDQIRNGDVYALVEIPNSFFKASDISKPDTLHSDESSDVKVTATANPKFYSQDSLVSVARAWLGSLIGQKLRESRMAQFGLDKIDPKIFALIDE